MNYKMGPQVVATVPANLTGSVPTSTLITIRFSVDLDVNYIQGNVRVVDGHGNPVAGQVTYKNRVITFTPAAPLRPAMLYKVTVIGDDPADQLSTGIRSVLGVPMAGKFTFSFMTAEAPTLAAPAIVWPKDGSVLQETEDFFLEWAPVERAKHYQAVLSTSNTLEPVIWPPVTQLYTTETKLIPEDLPDGLYYARVRAIDENGVPGDWSEVIAFRVDRAEVATVTPEDTLAPDPAVPGLEYPGHVTESYPAQDWSSVALNLKRISFTIADFTLTREEEQLGLSPAEALRRRVLTNEYSIQIERKPVDDDMAVPEPVTYEDIEVQELHDGRLKLIVLLP